jgi:hypothetical protein
MERFSLPDGAAPRFEVHENSQITLPVRNP